jgi:hypothetical protein
MIVRYTRSADPFARVPRVTLNDPRLTWKAKGILAYLLSKPDDWIVRRRDILAHGKGGDEAIREGFKELEAAGYAEMVTTNQGKEWHVRDVSALVAKTATSENPNEGFPALSKNEPTKKENPPKPPKGGGQVLLFPIWKKRLQAIFNRRDSTVWSAKEMKAFDAACPIDDADLAAVEEYYRAERHKEKNICRRDLLTLLNNWPGEVDRARAFCSRRAFKKRRTAGPAPAKEGPATEGDFKHIGGLARAELERFRAKMKPGANGGEG